MSSLAKIIAVAKGLEKGDLLFRNGKVVNVFSGEVLQADVIIAGDTVAAVGKGYLHAQKVVDLQGAYLLPGLIDGHIHVESSMLTPSAFARTVLPHGTTSVICDPHEIVNVAGLKGLAFMLKDSEGVPLDFHFMIPSCVPASPLENSGAVMDKEEIRKGFEMVPGSPGLAEMMNYPGVIMADPEVLSRIQAATEKGFLADGHAPLLRGKELSAYVSSGISTDHECVSTEEAMEKIRLGMKVLIREGSSARNLVNLLPAVNWRNYRRFMFASDDRHPAHLLYEGEMDDILRKAVKEGLDAVTAVSLATYNIASHYRLYKKGAVAPGYKADLVVVNNLEDFKVQQVYKNGQLVAQEGRLVAEIEGFIDPELNNSVKLPSLRGKFKLPPAPAGGVANVISVRPDQIITDWEKISASSLPPAQEVQIIAVVERYSGKGEMTVGLVKGFGLQKGALASTIAHDSHNLIILGCSEREMETAARTLRNFGGGLVVAEKEQGLAFLPLPVGGIMSQESAPAVAASHAEVEKAARYLGCVLPSPFMTMSFLSLPVIPSLKITSKGLVDVKRLTYVPLWEQ